MSRPYTRSKNNQRETGASRLVSRSDYSSTLKIEVTFISETSVKFQRTTRRYKPETVPNNSDGLVKKCTIPPRNDPCDFIKMSEGLEQNAAISREMSASQIIKFTSVLKPG
jgi:hypothetical protein